jgi:hypothetical protein
VSCDLVATSFAGSSPLLISVSAAFWVMAKVQAYLRYLQGVAKKLMFTQDKTRFDRVILRQAVWLEKLQMHQD